MNIKRFHQINEESAPRLPIDEKYWLRKGKVGKNVCLHFHDDCDGIVSAITIKKWLIDKGFKIDAYNVVNYTDGWANTTFDPKLINVAVDYAEDHPDIDCYIDHHGIQESPTTNIRHSIKTKTGSAYEGICLQLGIPTDSLILYVIDMIDSAKYVDYGVDILQTLDLNFKNIKTDKKARLNFAASFNQMIKRSDYKTLIEVVENTTSPSIFAIYNQFKYYYTGNNINKKTGVGKNFRGDADYRIGRMKKMTQGESQNKIIWKSQDDFIKGYLDLPKERRPKGYQIIGDLAFIPTGTWANPIRARAILEKDIRDGIIPSGKIKFIFLQYGATLQVCGFDKVENYAELPKLKNGEEINNLGKYMNDLVEQFKNYDKLKYDSTVTKAGLDPSEVTFSGGHIGIGSISNIIRKCDAEGPFKGFKFVDLFKNKIIQDLSGVSWPRINLAWRDPEEPEAKKTPKEETPNKLMMKQADIRKDRRL